MMNIDHAHGTAGKSVTFNAARNTVHYYRKDSPVMMHMQNGEGMGPQPSHEACSNAVGGDDAFSSVASALREIYNENEVLEMLADMAAWNAQQEESSGRLLG